MPLFDTFYYDQKWSLWDTWKSFGRNARGYVITAAYHIGHAITTHKSRGQVVTTHKSRGQITIAGG